MSAGSYSILSTVVPTLSYKPGWTFTLHALDDGHAQVDVEFPAVNARTRTGDPVATTAYFTAPSDLSSTVQALVWVRDILGWIEAHERDEWLRTGNRLVHDPHLGGRDLHGWTYPPKPQAEARERTLAAAGAL